MKRLVIFIIIVGGLVYVMRDNIRPYFDKSATKPEAVSDKKQSHHPDDRPRDKQELINATMQRMDTYNNAGK